MNASHDLGEATFQLSLFDREQHRAKIPESITVSGIHRAVMEGDIEKASRRFQSGESVNKRESQFGYSPLHLAVMCVTVTVDQTNDRVPKDYDPGSPTNMLEYLLTVEGAEVNATCWEGTTPLYLAASLEDLYSLEKLIEAGADVNASDDDGDRPLHVAVHYWSICEFLLEHGAVISTDAKWKDTMQVAIREDCLDVVHMLLYYNADANVLDACGCTPFMTALRYGKREAQEALLDYVDDFNVVNSDGIWPETTLSYALRSNSPFVRDVIERGADVNYADDLDTMTSPFLACVHHGVDLEAFEAVWERLRFNYDKNTVDLIQFLDFVDKVSVYLPVVLESSNFKVVVRFFSKYGNYFLFVKKYAEKKLDLDQLATLTYRLLESGFRATSYDIGAVFSHFGDCELFRILTYMDIDATRGWLPGMALPRLIFDVHFNLESIIDDLEAIPEENLMRLLEYSICPALIDALTLRYSGDETMSSLIRSLPRAPSLMELARNATRKQIWHSCKMTNTCQFYTAIDHFRIPALYKDILKFKRKIYIIQQ